VSRLQRTLLLGLCVLPLLGAGEDLPGDARRRVQADAQEYVGLSQQIWELAEPAMKEFRSARLLADDLRRHGFQVEMGVAGMPTAFVARAGRGRPVVGLLAEYDGLPGMSQKTQAVRAALVEGGVGHGCGHNLLGVAAVAAARSAAATLREHGLPGTVILYGTPAEETGVGKVFMARSGLFDEPDVVLNWHPADTTIASYGTTLAVNSVRFRFRGVSAHAAAAPSKGRSALDAVEITNVAVNFLREHVEEDVRIHYVITDGGQVPNVVPESAEVWYFIRAPRRAQVEVLYERVLRCARAGALATGTELEVILESAFYEVNPNEALARILDRHLRAAGPPHFDSGDRQLALDLRRTLGLMEGRPLADTILPPAGGWAFKASTDVGDVSWITPTTLLKVATWPAGCPPHTWQAVASGGGHLGESGMMLAAEAMAGAAVELLIEPGSLRQVREEFERRTLGFTFVSGMPAEIGPPSVNPPQGYPSGTLEAR